MSSQRPCGSKQLPFYTPLSHTENPHHFPRVRTKETTKKRMEMQCRLPVHAFSLVPSIFILLPTSQIDLCSSLQEEAERASYLKGEVGTGTESTAAQSQDTTRMVWCDKNTIYFNLTLAGRIQYQKPKATQGLRQIKLRLCIISAAVFGYGHHNSNSPSELANNPTPKTKNSWCAQKYCSEAEKILQALTPLARQSPSCWLLI